MSRRELIDQLISEKLGSEFEIEKAPIGRGHDNYFVSSNEEEYFLKISENDTRFQVEGPVLELLHSCTGIKLPQVICFDNSKSDYPFMYLITEFMEGDNIDRWENKSGRKFPFLSKENKRKLLYNAGEQLGRLHSQTEREEFGFLESENQGLKFREKCGWPEIFEKIIIDEQVENFPERFSSLKSKIKDFVLNNREIISECGTSAIIHQDFRWPNILVEGSEISAVLDWERALYADPEYDLAKAEESLLQFKTKKACEKYRKSFFQGYKTHRSLSDNWEKKRNFYRALRPVEALWTFKGWTKNMSKDKKDEMASINVEKLNRRINTLN